jgi:hypothetical protein
VGPEEARLGPLCRSRTWGGVPDWAAAPLTGDGFASNMTRAVAGRDPARELVVLAHQPKHIHESGSIAGAGLQISGHVHGGQIFPLHVPVFLANPYFAGLYRHETFVPGNAGLEAAVASVPEGAARALLVGGKSGGGGEDAVASVPDGAARALLVGGKSGGGGEDPPHHWWPTWIYVSRGSLFWGPPMRLLAPHEVTLITLRSGVGAGG